MSQYPIIFIDLDGTLNDHFAFPNGYNGLKWECVREFNWILNAVPDARLVISSAWRYLILRGSMNLDGFTNLLLSHGVECHGKIIGHTCADEEIECRGQQIRHWLNEHEGDRRYVVLDDLDLGISTAEHPFVQTDGDVGLTQGDATRAIAILRGNTR